MNKSDLFWNPLQRLGSFKVPLLLNLVVLLPYLLLTLYIKLTTLLHQYNGGILSRRLGIELLTTLFSEPVPAVPYMGLFTEATEIVWCVPVSICLFSLSLPMVPLGKRRFLFACAGLMTLLLLDDIFRVTLLLRILLGVPKTIGYLIYGGIGATIAVKFWRQISGGPYIFLIASGLLLGISGSVEFLPIPGIGTPIMLEDGFKLLGLLNITIYFWRICRGAIMRSASPPLTL
ncbi:MAG: hypothetical protein AAF152_15215 [Cyanobacteria bacterium P01_A01_bin.114]